MTLKATRADIVANWTLGLAPEAPPPYVPPVYDVPADLKAEFTWDMRRTSFLSLNTETLEIPWAAGANYTISVQEGFMVSADANAFQSVAVDLPLVTNPTPYIVSSDPVIGDNDTLNNSKIVITFDHKIVAGTGNIYFYKDDTTDVLLKTFNVKTDVQFNNNVVTLPVTNLITANTTYYILTDAGVFRDLDNFVFPQITSPSTFSYTTAPFPFFHELFALEFSFSNLVLNSLIIRNTAVNPMLVTATSTPVVKAIRKGVAAFSSAITVFARNLRIKKSGIIPAFTNSAVLTAIVQRVKDVISLELGYFAMLANVGMKKGTAVSLPVNTTVVANVLYVKRATVAMESHFYTSILGTELFDTINDPNAYGTLDGDTFGAQISINNNYLLSIAPGEDTSTTNYVGKAYLFDITNYSLVHTFNEETGAGVYPTVSSGVITSSYAILGSPAVGDIGKVFVYNLSDYSLAYTFTNPNANTQNSLDRFGSNIVATDDYVIVSATEEDSPGYTNSSAVYVYDLTTGTLLYSIPNPSPSLIQKFGHQTAVYQDTLVVSGINNVLIYDLTTGTLQSTITTPAELSADTDSFGTAVAIYGNKVAISAPDFDQVNSASSYLIPGTGLYGFKNAGIVYVYNLDTLQIEYTVEPVISPSGYDINYSGQQFGGIFSSSGSGIILDDKNLIVAARTTGVTDVYSGPVGRVHIYSSTNGQLITYIDNSVGGGQFLGTSLAMNSTKYFASAPNNGYGYGIDGGQIRVYDRAMFNPTTEILTLKVKAKQTTVPNYFVRSTTANITATSTTSATLRRRYAGGVAALSTTASISCAASKKTVTGSELTVKADLKVPDLTAPMILDINIGLDTYISLQYSGVYDVTVDWGDGTKENLNYYQVNSSGVARRHNYVNTGFSGVAQVKIYRNTPLTTTVNGLQFQTTLSSGTVTNALTGMNAWGDMPITNIQFDNQRGLNYVPATIPTTLTNGYRMFHRAFNFNHPNVALWDTSNIVEMSGMFNDAAAFNQDLSGWCVSLIPTAPTQFATNSALANYPAKLPVWGTCP